MLQKKALNLYLRDLAVSFVVYGAILACAIRFGRPMQEGMLRTLVLLSPMIGFGMAIWTIARYIRRMDEYMRQTMLETLALAGAITAALTFSYGFLETAGYPRLSMFTVWMVMGASWGSVCIIRALLRR